MKLATADAHLHDCVSTFLKKSRNLVLKVLVADDFRWQ